MDHSNGSADDTYFYRVDLNKLSRIVKCSSTANLLAVLKKDALSSVGVVAENGHPHEFNVLPAAPLVDIPPIVSIAVVDSVHVPLVSTTMFPVLDVGLHTLFLAGISSVVILLCRQERKAAELLSNSSISGKMVFHIVFVDDDYRNKECGEAILEARKFLDKDFLYFQSSDIYEPGTLYALANAPLDGAVACILVDQQAVKKLEKPPKVQSNGQKVQALGMEITAYNTFSAGLYLLSHSLPKILQARSSLKKTCLLISVLNDLCLEAQVSCHTSAGAWMAVRNPSDIKPALEEFETFLGGLTMMFPGESATSGLVLGIPSLQKTISVSGMPSGMQKFRINHITNPQTNINSSLHNQTAKISLNRAHSLFESGSNRSSDLRDLPPVAPALLQTRSSPPRKVGRRSSLESQLLHDTKGPQYHSVHLQQLLPSLTKRQSSQVSMSRSFRINTLPSPAEEDEDFFSEHDDSPFPSPASTRGKCFAYPSDLPNISRQTSDITRNTGSAKSSTKFLDGGEFYGFHNNDHLVSIPEINEIDSVGHYQALLIQTDKEEFVLATPEYEQQTLTGTGLLCRPCRNSMHMPCEIEKLELQAVVDHELGKPIVEVIVTRKVPLLGWIILFITLIASSSTGPLEARLNFPPLLLNFWRRTCSGAMFFPFAMRSFLKPSVRQEFVEDMIPFGMALFGMTICNTCFYTALMYLDIPLVSLFENSVPLVLVEVRLFTGQAISWMEGIGTIIAMCGAAIVSVDALKSGSSSETGTTSYIHGSVCALTAAIGMAVYLTYAKKIRPTLDITLLNFAVCIVTPLASLILEVLFYQSDFGPFAQLPTKSRVGALFGYLLKPDLFIAQLGTSFIMDIVASQGALAVLCYFEALLVSVVLLTQPVVVILLDLVLGVSSFPSIMTLIGCTVVTLGCGFVVISSSGEHIEVIDASAFIETENSALDLKRSCRTAVKTPRAQSVGCLLKSTVETGMTKKYSSERYSRSLSDDQ